MARSPEQEQLDIAVATQLMGFRWVEWSKSLGGAPLYRPGRFLALDDDLTSHLYTSASVDAPLNEQALAKVPKYSQDDAAAFTVADRTGLFAEGKAVLRREPDGSWVIELRGHRMASASLAELLCHASLRWANTASHSG